MPIVLAFNLTWASSGFSGLHKCKIKKKLKRFELYLNPFQSFPHKSIHAESLYHVHLNPNSSGNISMDFASVIIFAVTLIFNSAF